MATPRDFSVRFTHPDTPCTPCGLSLRSGRLTAIRGKSLQDFAQIFATAKTSLNRIRYMKRPTINKMGQILWFEKMLDERLQINFISSYTLPTIR
jgi:hypothetical protein